MYKNYLFLGIRLLTIFIFLYCSHLHFKQLCLHCNYTTLLCLSIQAKVFPPGYLLVILSTRFVLDCFIPWDQLVQMFQSSILFGSISVSFLSLLSYLTWRMVAVTDPKQDKLKWKNQIGDGGIWALDISVHEQMWRPPKYGHPIPKHLWGSCFWIELNWIELN